MQRTTVFMLILGALMLLWTTSCSQSEEEVIVVEKPQWDNEFHTALPVVYINTEDGDTISSRTVWKTGVSMTVMGDDGEVDYEGTLQMKGRGNSSWGFPKRSYTLKLDKKHTLLGMPEHKRWCLIANWMDRTLLRNAVGLEIARRTTGLDWTPSGRFVELVFNGVHRGNYFLCEQIRVDENRVNIAPLDKTATEGTALEGGYIFELDVNYDEPYKFKTPARYDADGGMVKKEIPWQFKVPDEVNEAQFDYVQQYVAKMEDALYDSVPAGRLTYLDYIDVNSFIDWWLASELAQNSEIWAPKSVYLHKDIGGKMMMGPVWDYDWGTFVPQTSYGYVADYLYYDMLFEDAYFRRLVKQRWLAQKAAFESVVSFIDETANAIEASEALNTKLWPLDGRQVNGDEALSFRDAVERLKRAYLEKLNWMDARIQTYE